MFGNPIGVGLDIVKGCGWTGIIFVGVMPFFTASHLLLHVRYLF